MRRFQRGDWQKGYAASQQRSLVRWKLAIAAVLYVAAAASITIWPTAVIFAIAATVALVIAGGERRLERRYGVPIFRFARPGAAFSLGGRLAGRVEFPGDLPRGPYRFRLLCQVHPSPSSSDEPLPKHLRWQEDRVSPTPDIAFDLPANELESSPNTSLSADVRWRLELRTDSLKAYFELPVFASEAEARSAAETELGRPLEQVRIEEPVPGKLEIELSRRTRLVVSASLLEVHRRNWWGRTSSFRFDRSEIGDILAERSRESGGRLFYNVVVRTRWRKRVIIGSGIPRSDAEAVVEAITNLLTA